MLHGLLLILSILATPLTNYVDPSIGTERYGHVFVGPCHPFGMVKPSPDVQGCNPGWGPMDKPIEGFSQLHVSGTGGAPKYGNILLMPFVEGMEDERHAAMREDETISIGYYSTNLSGSGIKVEVTSAAKAALYRITYPEGSDSGLEIDAGFCLKTKKGTGQNVLDGEVTATSATEICGFTTAEGGWGGGRPYTVYFCISSDTPIGEAVTMDRQMNIAWKGKPSTVNLKVGISFISIDKARDNLISGLGNEDFGSVRAKLISEWENLLSRITIDSKADEHIKRMFYTGIYHTMLMPSRRTGEWSKCAPEEPYFDDYFTLWDTYRTSLPLITIAAPEIESEIVSSLINIFRYDGYMPDGRSGNSNGATQGSSNADIVIADAFVKGLDGIDYETGLEAMLKDANVPPENERFEGRGGLEAYKTLGYIPWGISKAGNRTVDGSYCDYAISVVAEGLGRKELAEEFRLRSHNWTNLWRDYEEDGIRGFIMPRDAEGNWLDEGAADINGRDTVFVFRPNTSFRHWNNYFYEANCYETSLCAPHDMGLLIEKCGGTEDLKKRLDLMFVKGYCDIGNEPSFLISSLYHWVGRPDLTYETVSRLIANEFGDGPGGIPGNDDSGAMSSWLVFHMMGLYPVSATDRYLVHTPMVRSCSLNAGEGRKFVIKAPGLSKNRTYIKAVRLNGKKYEYSTIRHSDIIRGGKMVLKMSRRPGKWGGRMYAETQDK